MIRQATISDVEAIHALNTKVLGYDIDKKVTEQQLATLLERRDHFILVAETNSGSILGYAHAAAYDCLYFPPLLNLLALAVGADFQGQGYGAALMQALREVADPAGYTGLRINSGIARTEAHAFYRAIGCQEKADQKRFFWNWEESE